MVERFTPCDWPHATMVEDSDGGYVSYYDYEKLQQRLATVDVERDRLLEVVKLFYRKHVLNDESIGWDELGDKLYNELSEILGDKEFCKWLDTQSM